MSGMEDVTWLDATGQAELVRRLEVKPVELLESAIERVEALNPRLNAVVTPMFDQARSAAAGVIPDGPFKGVPFLLKDVVAACKDVRMTLGAGILQHFVADHDSELVRRLRRAGLIILGKTNTPEFGLLPTTEPRLFGPCRNPWDTGRSTGGSSGGSAAAVAAGMVPMAHGNDGGGSIRIPASCCGLFGLKPTRARNPLGPDFGDLIGGLVAEHALTRSVRDSAALLDATSGPDIGDPYWAPPPVRPFIREVGANPGRLRIALLGQLPGGPPLHPDCAAAWQDAAALCADLGHEVEEVQPELSYAAVSESFMLLWSASLASTIDTIFRHVGQPPEADQFEPLTWALYENARRHSAADYLMTITNLQRTARKFARWFTNHDVWLTPVLSEPPVPLGQFGSTPDHPLQGMDRATEYVPFTPFANVTGQPAMSVPLYWNRDGLPIGAHFMGRFGDEATLFRLAAQLEEARPWQGRRPPVSA